MYGEMLWGTRLTIAQILLCKFQHLARDRHRQTYPGTEYGYRESFFYMEN